MSVSCCIPNCSNEVGKVEGKTFHLFPQKQTLLYQKWIRAINEKDFQPDMKAHVCCDHFKDSDFIIYHNSRKLKKEAYPTVFNGVDIDKELIEQIEGNVTREGNTLYIKDKRSINEGGLDRIMRKLSNEKESNRLLRRKLKIAQQTIRRLRVKINSLKDVITLLNDQLVDTDKEEVHMDIAGVSVVVM